MKHDIFEFNHIDSLLSEEEITTLKEFYKYYHKINDNRHNLWWFDNEPNRSWCNQWCWNTSDKFWKNEKLQKENRNDIHRVYHL